MHAPTRPCTTDDASGILGAAQAYPGASPLRTYEAVAAAHRVGHLQHRDLPENDSYDGPGGEHCWKWSVGSARPPGALSCRLPSEVLSRGVPHLSCACLNEWSAGPKRLRARRSAVGRVRSAAGVDQCTGGVAPGARAPPRPIE
eukprot:360468-Chlamydomonas_euryale.AAC.8